MTLLEVRVQHLVVVSVAPWIPVTCGYVAAKNETCDNQTRRQERDNAPLLCPFDSEKLHSMLSPPSSA